jgi:CBS domain containing-hemolysin-like protein
MSRLGRLPRSGDAVEVDGVRLKASKMDGRRVARVRVTVLAAPDGEEATGTSDASS